MNRLITILVGAPPFSIVVTADRVKLAKKNMTIMTDIRTRFDRVEGETRKAANYLTVSRAGDSCSGLRFQVRGFRL